jgi:pimeloyl-ACP methyl ester carboxylesterase
MAPQEKHHRVRDIEVRLLEAGQGKPVLFLHGAGGVPPWNEFFDAIAARYRLLVPEHPGFGTDANAATIRSVADLAMYYLDFLDALDDGPAHVIGHSLGGWAAAELAVRNCSRLATLTLIAPAGIRIMGVPSGDNFIWSPEETARNLYHDQSFAEKMLARTLSEDEGDRALTNRFMAARLGWEPRWFNPHLERWLHRISVPTLLIWGADDKLMPSAYAKRWKELVPQAATDIVPECGHIPFIEKAGQVSDKVLAFLGGHSR